MNKHYSVKQANSYHDSHMSDMLIAIMTHNFTEFS